MRVWHSPGAWLSIHFRLDWYPRYGKWYNFIKTFRQKRPDAGSQSKHNLMEYHQMVTQADQRPVFSRTYAILTVAYFVRCRTLGNTRVLDAQPNRLCYKRAFCVSPVLKKNNKENS